MIRKEILNASPEQMENVSGIVTEIERYAIHDGPGIRTLLFLKGCPLRCKWCCNPETQQGYVEMIFFEEKCIKCDRCLNACPYGAIAYSDEKMVVNKSVCKKNCFGRTQHFPCTINCYTKARRVAGELITVSQAFMEISRDISFYEATGGGVTLSGGEPMMQAEFAYALLRTCKENWINTAMETSASGSLKDYKEILPYLDVLFVDLKSTNPTLYAQWTQYNGNDALAVIHELSEMAEKYTTQMYIRIPVIPGFNDTQQDIREIGCFIKEKCRGFKGIELLPYHKLGRGKYKSLGLHYELNKIEPPSEERMDEYSKILLNMGISIYKF